MNILIAEDDRSLRKGLRYEIEELGHTVSEAEDGQEAITLFKNNQFDLIISDLVMPNIDGLELYKTIHNINPSTKFLMITLFSNSESAKEAKCLLKENYFEKSSNLDNLTKKVSELFNG